VTLTAEPVTKISTPLKTVYLKRGASFTIPVVAYSSDGKSTELTWTSGNEGVATVNQSGKVTAKKKGAAKITAKARNGKSVTVTVNVVDKAKKPLKLTITGTPKSLKIGKTAQLKVKITPASATNLNVTFKSSKPGVLKVDKAGGLTAKKKGRAIITVKAGDKTAKKTITVK
jgi:VCBS repeat-containing protein